MKIFSLSVAVASLLRFKNENEIELTTDVSARCGAKPLHGTENWQWNSSAAPPQRAWDLCVMELLTAPTSPDSKRKTLSFVKSSLPEVASLLSLHVVGRFSREGNIAQSFAVAAAVQATVQKTTGHFFSALSSIENDRLSDLHQAFEFFRNNQQGSQGNLSAVNKQMKRIDLSIHRALLAGDIDSANNLLFHRQASLANWPYLIQSKSYQQSHEEYLERQRNILKVLKPLSNQTRVELETLIGRIDLAANPSFVPRAKTQVMFHGPPGVGKNYVLEQLAKSLHRPLFFARLTSASFYLNGVTDLLGEPFDRLTANGRWKDVPSSTCEMVGWLACGLFLTQVVNPIIAFDEASLVLNDPVMLPTLKKVFNPQETIFPIGSFGGVTIDLSRATFVFLGNDKIFDSALRSRIDTIRFEPLKISQKKHILNDLIDEKEKEYSLLYPLHVKEIKVFFQELMESVAEHEELFNFPGVRLMNSVIDKTASLYAGRITNGAGVDKHEIKEILKSHYEKEAHFMLPG